MFSLLAAVNVGDSVQTALDSLFGFLPKLIGFIIVLAIGWIVAKVIKTAVTKLLQKLGLDKALHSGTTGQYVDRIAPDTSPSHLVGSLAFWFIFLGALTIAVSQLGIDALDNFVAAIGAYLPNIIAAVLIFVAAAAIATAIAGLVARTMGDTPTGKIVGSVAPVLVMAIATFMILNQLQIAEEIVTITYAALSRLRGTGHGTRLRPRWPRARRPHALRRIREGPGAARPGQARPRDRQGGARRDAERVMVEPGNGPPEASTDEAAAALRRLR